MNKNNIINIEAYMKYSVNDEIGPKLKGLVMEIMETDKKHLKIDDKPVDGQVDQKLKALMADLNIDTKEINSAISEIDRKKLVDQMSNMDKTKPEKLKF